MVPKTIMAFLINKTKDNSQQILYSQLTDDSDIQTLMSEDPMIEEARNECKYTLKNLKNALDLLNEARDFNYYKEDPTYSMDMGMVKKSLLDSNNITTNDDSD